MTYDKNENTVTASSDELAAYSVSKPVSANQSAGFLRVFDIDENGIAAEKNFPLRIDTALDRLSVRIEASADEVLRFSGGVTVCVHEYTKRIPAQFIVSYNHTLLAKAVITAYAFSLTETDCHGRVRVRITFIHTENGKSASFEREYSSAELKFMTETLLSRAEPFLRAFAVREGTARDELTALSFPYKEVRPGQEELMLGVVRAIRRGEKLVAAAPTGTGKTMATLYPSLKALSERYIDRVFYLTSKTVTGKAAYEAMELISKTAPHVRTIMIHSKERTCQTGLLREGEGCRACPRMHEAVVAGNPVQYGTRQNLALAELLEYSNMYNMGEIASTAEKYAVCPYELSLDLSEWCDVIICDCNYAFDTRMRFRRYFLADRGEKYAFLIDEAHNLPDRIRTSYTASFSPSDLSELAELVLAGQICDDELASALSACSEVFEAEREAARENSTLVNDRGGEHISGFSKSDSVPAALMHSAAVIGKICRDRCREQDDFFEIYDGLYSKISAFSAAVKVFGEGFVFLSRLYDDSLTCSVICLDPSEVISQMCDAAHSTVMFSATLSPTEYFADALGCRGGAVLEAESPFDPEHLSVTVFDGVSTRLSDRRATAASVAEIIKTVIDARDGNYMVFFPSYSYMKTVARELLSAYPDIRAVMQKEHMTHKEREKFISAFRSGKYGNILGLCVLGGVFSEGIDLTGDSLIGVIAVGIGLSGLSTELNLIREYYDAKYEMGYEYSYLYPAINKLEQAAGRVIRTADDRGCVVLIDDRLASPEIRKMFPSFWRPVGCTSDTESLSIILQRFWGEH